jgi:hypothetical protein
MIRRCYEPKCDHFIYYGGRGILVCDRWLESVDNFIDDMGKCPDGFSLDRIDLNGNYCPENCKWITQAEQMRNTRKNHFITIDGKTKCVREWLKIYNIRSSSFYYRKSLGYSDEEALNKENKKWNYCYR